ncbi:hypothetical protein AB0E85_39430 [Streptomyces sp. NPDC029044]|nr:MULTISPECIES: hypothetical protein [Streptomyces]MZF83839.1 hypothetical protein [Streptomyces sp. SID5643]MZF90304.1 hypothetical protein [Streptomyces sp. SID5643]
MTHMKRTATVLSSLALSVAVLGGTAAASDADLLSEAGDQSTSRECNEHDSLGLTLLGIPLLGFFFPDQC